MVDTAAGAKAVVLPMEASVKAARVVGDTFIVVQQEDLFLDTRCHTDLSVIARAESRGMKRRRARAHSSSLFAVQVEGGESCRQTSVSRNLHIKFCPVQSTDNKKAKQGNAKATKQAEVL